MSCGEWEIDKWTNFSTSQFVMWKNKISKNQILGCVKLTISSTHPNGGCQQKTNDDHDQMMEWSIETEIES